MRRRRVVRWGAVLAAVSVLCACATPDEGPPAFSRPTTAVPSATPKPSVAPTLKAPSAAVNWSVDFNGPAGSEPDPSLFQFRTGGTGWGNEELESYTDRASNAALDGAGHLAIHAVREKYTGTDGITRDWTSARLDTLGKWAFTTGTISVRMKVPTGAGMWPAFWLLGANLPTVGWPTAGEIDVVEALGGKSTVYQSVHGPTTDGKAFQSTQQATGLSAAALAGQFHVYAVTRAPNSLVFSVDGIVTARFTPANLTPKQKWVFNEPMFMTINLAVGGWPGTPTAATPSPSTLLVDWVRFAP